MVQAQIISKILQEKDNTILIRNGLSEDFFPNYLEEYRFIDEYFRKYKKVPDKETFLDTFEDFTIIEVNEPESYLISKISEENLYGKLLPVLQKTSKLMLEDSRTAVEYFKSQIGGLSFRSEVTGVDIISQARERFDVYEKVKSHPEEFLISTGFAELDQIVGGWHRGEELVTIFARTNNGKTWLLLKTLEDVWRQGYRVGLVEPEMSADKVGYRFDTLRNHFSNISMIRGKEIEGYEEYIENLSKNPVSFYVAHPRDFGRKVTVSKLRSFVMTNKLDILAIDGISYLTDERTSRGDSRTTQLTQISEDLMDLSIELKIPIIVVCQSNREGVKDNQAPGLENIRDSDGIAFNSSVVISVRQKNPILEVNIVKNRNGVNGGKLSYTWNIDNGVFTYAEQSDESPENVQEPKPQYSKKKESVF